MAMCEEKKTFKSVSELIRSFSDDEAYNDELDEMIQQREVVKTLLALRVARGVSQGEVANRLHCSQSRVSKIENGRDGDVRLSELAAYAEAMGYDVEVVFKRRNETIVDAVKRHAFRIRDLLHRLAGLSHKDEKIAEGAVAFFSETFFNMVKIISDSAEQLPAGAAGKPRMSMTVEDEQTGDVDRARRRLLSKSDPARHGTLAEAAPG